MQRARNLQSIIGCGVGISGAAILVCCASRSGARCERQTFGGHLCFQWRGDARRLFARCRRRVFRAQFEIIIVDDGYTDDSANIARQFHVRVEQGPHHGLAAARNIGWRAAQSAWVAFTDDDCIPIRHWLQFLWRAVHPEQRAERVGRSRVESLAILRMQPHRVTWNCAAGLTRTVTWRIRVFLRADGERAVCARGIGASEWP